MAEAEKEARELCELFYDGSPFDYTKEEHVIQKTKAKHCAIICVDKMIDNNEECVSRYKSNYDRVCIREFWQGVKQAIEEL